MAKTAPAVDVSAIREAFEPIIDSEQQEVEWQLRRDDHGRLPSERLVIAALRLIKDLERSRIGKDAPPVGDFRVWHAHEALRLSYDKLSSDDDPKVPTSVRSYLVSRGTDVESRRTIAIRCVKRVEQYRQHCETLGNVGRGWFRLVYEISTNEDK